MADLRLAETFHPHKDMAAAFDALIAIDDIKRALVDELALILDRQRLENWKRTHHPAGLALADRAKTTSPLIILAGDVGCGKTALAACVATPVARAIGQKIACYETPSDVRGSGLVGELSTRLTEAFTQARMKAARTGRGLLIIDEADDIATRRGQMQAHHEDRAGVNVLIKQLDQLARDPTPMAVIMITNRASVLDPAVLRRAVLILEFGRPDDAAREALFAHLLDGTGAAAADIAHLVTLTRTNPPYTFSDLAVRLARVALRRALEGNQPFNVAVVEAALRDVKPSPPMEASQAT